MSDDERDWNEDDHDQEMEYEEPQDVIEDMEGGIQVLTTFKVNRV
jgi:hypothetical protein